MRFASAWSRSASASNFCAGLVLSPTFFAIPANREASFSINSLRRNKTAASWPIFTASSADGFISFTRLNINIQSCFTSRVQSKMDFLHAELKPDRHSGKSASSFEIFRPDALHDGPRRNFFRIHHHVLDAPALPSVSDVHQSIVRLYDRWIGKAARRIGIIL